MPFTFIPNKNVEASGTSLIQEIDSVSMDYLTWRFPEAFSEYEEDSEKGYGNQHLTFQCQETGHVFTVYSRWNIPRIGGNWNASEEEKTAFYNFITQQ